MQGVATVDRFRTTVLGTFSTNVSDCNLHSNPNCACRSLHDIFHPGSPSRLPPVACRLARWLPFLPAQPSIDHHRSSFATHIDSLPSSRIPQRALRLAHQVPRGDADNCHHKRRSAASSINSGGHITKFLPLERLRRLKRWARLFPRANSSRLPALPTNTCPGWRLSSLPRHELQDFHGRPPESPATGARRLSSSGSPSKHLIIAYTAPFALNRPTRPMAPRPRRTPAQAVVLAQHRGAPPAPGYDSSSPTMTI
ncbi:hypothetical protein LLEC1_06396 [Akanthomyces lecanii]|uniref:Uncharacterized protein n=1 Tax=Cordyceps confragosa TaxID=2714763 RepID=A0A179I5N0_CORDF|nr:hypothetical protein LLEC1_06396 [Akanthomyces lecanii]